LNTLLIKSTIYKIPIKKAMSSILMAVVLCYDKNLNIKKETLPKKRPEKEVHGGESTRH